MSKVSHRLESDAPRLDKFLAEAHPEVARSRWDLWIRAGNVQVDGAPVTKGGTKVKAGSLVETELPEVAPPARHLEAEDLALPTIFEDGRIWIVDKPAGMVVHPGPGHPGGSVVNALLHRLQTAPPLPVPASEEDEGEEGDDLPPPAWPGLVHRLDRYTTGCLALSKDAAAQADLQRQFKARTVEKRYLALVRASRKLPELGSLLVDAPIARHKHDRLRMCVAPGGRPSQTRIRVLDRSSNLALVECELLTGRTHQIRVHLKHLDAPLLGDPLYGGPSRWLDAAKQPMELPHPMLHAWKLSVDHPEDRRRIEAVAPLPEAFKEAMARLGLEMPQH